MDTTQNTNGITIRRLGPGDEAAIERLVELDSGRRPEGAMMGVEIEGRLLVATSVETGESIADPFSRTAELRTLLEVRIDQMNGKARGTKRHSRPLPLPRSAGRISPRRGRQAPHAPRPARLSRSGPHPGLERPPRYPSLLEGLRDVRRSGQCCSSGAMVRPASESCSQ